MLLNRLYYTYKTDVLNYHHRVLQESGISTDSIPEAYLSQAAQGNILEVLNMALNVFEKHFIERSLDRTGQLVIVVSPGMGEFDVDRQLTNITKQRVMDNGVGIDLICVGQEPLYAVPLFLFQNRDELLGDDYSIPHWINLSFYRSKHMPPRSSFIPRLKVPYAFSNIVLNRKKDSIIVPPKSLVVASMRDTFTNCEQDYLNYDADVFDNKYNDLPTRCDSTNNTFRHNTVNKVDTRKKKISSCSIDVNLDTLIALSRSLSPLKQRSITPPPKNPCFDSEFSEFVNLSCNKMRSRSFDDLKKIGNESVNQRAKDTENSQADRTLLNPFDKSQYLVKLTSNRRRWSHTFPEKCIKTKKFAHEGNGNKNVNNAKRVKFLKKKRLYFKNFDIEKSLNKQIRKKQSVKRSFQSNESLGSTNGCSSIVDWKSMVFPACLPITTDYFPDDVSLQSFYVFSNYNLLPEDVNAEVALQRAVYRPPLGTKEVFYQMVYQRLSQGFQLVVNKADHNDQKKKISSLVMRPTQSIAEPFIEMRLSIGRIVHIVTLCGSEIRVTRYRPRFPYATFEIQYRYRFQAPDHSTYGISWISFITEKLENFNWNYMDNYLCVRGDMDYALHEKLKYWRFRMYLLPWRQEATKVIMGHLHEKFYCDIYKTPTVEEQKRFTNKFIKFLETWVNRVKRPTISLTSANDLSPYRDRANSSSLHPFERPQSRTCSKVYDRTITSLFPETYIPDDASDDSESNPVELVINESSSNVELVEYMCNTQIGIGFVNRNMGLPQNTFVSNDAIKWLMDNLKSFDSRSKAVDRLQDILNEGLICHASGDSSHPFIDGFYLYYMPVCESPTDQSFPKHDFQAFENEWVEVEVKEPIQYPSDSDILMESLSLPEPLKHSSKWEVPWYKEAHLEVDVNSKSDCVEWGHAHYQSLYRCDHAYEIIAQWVAASGSVVADLIYTWARTAQTGGFQLIPLPADPFALPYTLKADPLRGPVFVPIHLECLLKQGENNLFHEYSEDSWSQRLLLFQETILYRFGFVICNSKNNNDRESCRYHNQYIHLTGNVFVLILSDLIDEITEKNDSPDQGLSDLEAGNNQQETLLSPHMEYITRHVYHRSPKDNDPKIEKRVGYLWAWNHMVSRRWKWSNPATGDEDFQNKLLKDFRHFCSNKDDRLLKFWNNCKT
ncbi:Hypothetical protein CINCED_3A011295 [Cinara cedri]|nr:Hypothetical protein CINCED_3A011295 [Cinara cedri]